MDSHPIISLSIVLWNFHSSYTCVCIIYMTESDINVILSLGSNQKHLKISFFGWSPVYFPDDENDLESMFLKNSLAPPTPGLLHQPLEEKEERPRWPTLSKSPRWFCGPAGLGSTTKIRDSESRWPPPDLLAPPTHSPLLRRSWGVYSNLNSSYLEVLDCMSRVTCKIEIKGEQHRALPIL